MRNVGKRAIAFCILLISALLRGSIALPAFFGGRGLLLIPAVVALSLFEETIPALLYGFAAGVLWDLTAAGRTVYFVFGRDRALRFAVGALCDPPQGERRAGGVRRLFAAACGSIRVCRGKRLRRRERSVFYLRTARRACRGGLRRRILLHI